MPTVKSADGTAIAYTRTGQGPPLVLVHGISADAARWSLVVPGLGARATVHAMDRRGRGGSGDGAVYALDRELEDVVAVVEAAAAGGEEVTLFGHSFGGLCAMYASLLTTRLKRLVLYEPYVAAEPAREPSLATRRYEALAATGDREAVVGTFLREIIQLSEAEVAKMRALPTWASRIAAAHTIPRELRAAEQLAFDPALFHALRVPVTMMVGEESPAFLKEATDRIRAALPARPEPPALRVLEGQKHSAMNTAPDLFVRALMDVLDG